MLRILFSEGFMGHDRESTREKCINPGFLGGFRPSETQRQGAHCRVSALNPKPESLNNDPKP